MKFINRESELKALHELYDLSSSRLFPVLLFGPRRIGKTRLLREFCKDKKHLYFFVYEGKGLNSTLKEFEKELKEKKIIDDSRTLLSMEEFIDILFKYPKGYIIIFDEIQSMLSIYKPFFSIMQRKIDDEKDFASMIIFLGSVVGLIKKVFEDQKSPLYGRIKHEMLLKQLNYGNAVKMLIELGYSKKEDYVKLYSIFGGYPKYYVAMEDYNLIDKGFFEVIEFLFFRENAPLKSEVSNILRQEFGKSKSYYYDILEAIATGHTKLNEIASYVGKRQTDITPFIRELIDYYELIYRETIITEDPKKTRNSVYLLKSPIFKFWFRFIYPNLRYTELSRYDVIIEDIKKNINSFIGFGFEEVCRGKMSMLKEYSLIGRWWGYKRDDTGRKPVEIDIVALDETKKNILFGECKWTDNLVDVEVYKQLLENSKLVNWFNSERNEKFALFAKKGFTSKMKALAKKENVLLFTLGDL
jgi:AAA+ ATPase superfamily predicted ATPase